MIFAVGTFLYVLASTLGVYQAARYTESVQFCGKLCHTVMKPEYETHQISPHAIVKCTTCHVGPGPGWYEKSKVRGLGRVYDVLYAGYPRPIPAPIVDLRPTEIECHRCHWPEKFFGGRSWVFHNRLYDEKNTYWPVQMVVHTGGGDPGIDQTGGIHWYMNIGYKIEYIARDRQRQEIAWVRATNKKTGEVTIYQDQSNRLSAAEIESLPPRRMDCVDCHNTPTHVFHTPDYAIDMALFLKQIDTDLPDIKQATVFAMSAPYKTAEEAASGIPKHIEEFYATSHPAVYKNRQAALQQAVQATQRRFAENVFPYMKVDWKVYPDNVGHLYYRGCFRCHLGRHRSEQGKTIPHDCNTCHRIVAQRSGAAAERSASPSGLLFDHPVKIGGVWQTMACSNCHHGAGVGAASSLNPRPRPPRMGHQLRRFPNRPLPFLPAKPPGSHNFTPRPVPNVTDRQDARSRRYAPSCPNFPTSLTAGGRPPMTIPSWNTPYLRASRRSCRLIKESSDRFAPNNLWRTFGNLPAGKAHSFISCLIPLELPGQISNSARVYG